MDTDYTPTPATQPAQTGTRRYPTAAERHGQDTTQVIRRRTPPPAAAPEAVSPASPALIPQPKAGVAP